MEKTLDKTDEQSDLNAMAQQSDLTPMKNPTVRKEADHHIRNESGLTQNMQVEDETPMMKPKQSFKSIKEEAVQLTTEDN